LLESMPPCDAADVDAVDARNRRTHGRVPLGATPSRSAAYLSPHRVLIARVGDLSASGAFLSTAFPDPVGTRATLEIDVDGTRIALHVEVVRVSFFGGPRGDGAGMGVAFIDVPREIRRRLATRSASSARSARSNQN
jgi:hypothetical protein